MDETTNEESREMKSMKTVEDTMMESPTIPAMTCANCTMARIFGEDPRRIVTASLLKIETGIDPSAKNE